MPRFLTIMSNQKQFSDDGGVIVKFVAAVLLALVTGLGGGAYYQSGKVEDSMSGQSDAQLERRLTQFEMRLEQQTKATEKLEQSIGELRQSLILQQRKVR